MEFLCWRHNLLLPAANLSALLLPRPVLARSCSTCSAYCTSPWVLESSAPLVFSVHVHFRRPSSLGHGRVSALRDDEVGIRVQVFPARGGGSFYIVCWFSKQLEHFARAPFMLVLLVVVWNLQKPTFPVHSKKENVKYGLRWLQSQLLFNLKRFDSEVSDANVWWKCVEGFSIDWMLA